MRPWRKIRSVDGEGDPAALVMPAIAAVPSAHIWDNDSDDVDGGASVPHRRGSPMRREAPTRPVRGMRAKHARAAAPAAVVLHSRPLKKAPDCRKWSLEIPSMDAEASMLQEARWALHSESASDNGKVERETRKQQL